VEEAVAVMCRALKVLCVAPDDGSLMALKIATVSAEWELTPGATDLRGALDQIDAERPHVMVAFGPFEDLIAIARAVRSVGVSPPRGPNHLGAPCAW
jgi:hypothetical protein